MTNLLKENSADRGRLFSVAPMMDWTTRDYRAFARTLTRRALLYTEMVTTGAILHGTPRERFLGYNEVEHPLALQLGGSDASELAECAAIAEAWGYDEVNLNVGCPSDRVQNNLIGACLMGYPEKVADAVRAMQAAVSIPVTVKCRIGIDDQDEDADLERFIAIVADAGCEVFTVHARKAWLQGLSPKQNRDVPPLNYPRVHRLKQSRPELHIGINGGIKTLAECQEQLTHVDSVMVGREAYQNPWLLAGVDEQLFGEQGPAANRLDAAIAFRPYIQQRLDEGAKLNHITRHLLGLFQGCPGGRRFRRHLSEHAHKEGAGLRLFDDALSLVNEPELVV
ncbi:MULTISPECIES: tRNA dihydrouridine(20/20a) synthase DusA [unclassified Halomonas]|uniref:tRNA dihydrouridine(20/20a) synthase DusA n=1 Tax=unclassified Halomonas TaxID=2609666 RepID=UPI001CF1805B|nr:MULTISPECIES: tRNA dihydrouridine(20/20a) synthase DusA [unclassified Halomonas]MCA8864065.1 tRNA dihydrouridine(20/20a) synthase DusA [Halomonas sp. SBBP1]UZH11304.1 tRNA dihydrouridine(20/20a) synthase DusA [Halomonas sp. BDJS001]